MSEIVRLGECSRLFAGGTPRRDQPEYYSGGTIPWFKSGEVRKKYLREAEEHITEIALDESSARRIPAGSILLAMYGATAGQVGISCINASANQAILAIIPDSRLVPEYLYYTLLFNTPEALKRTQGSGQPNLSKEIVEAMRILIPEKLEQSKIAEILSSVDQVIELTEKEISRLEDLKKGMMNDLFTKGIGHTKFKDSPIGKIPEGWESNEIGEYASVIDPQPDHRTPKEVHGGVSYVGMGDIQKNGKIDFGNCLHVAPEVLEKQKSLFDIHNGAFVFGKIGTIGNPTRIPVDRLYAYSANLVLITGKDSDFIDYLYFYMGSSAILYQVSNESNTTSQPALGIQKVRKFCVAVPPREEMRRVTAILIGYESLKEAKNKKLNILKNLKIALMNDLLTGKVRVKV